MSTEALKGLDVGRIAHRDAALFMWATDAHIPGRPRALSGVGVPLW